MRIPSIKLLLSAALISAGLSSCDEEMTNGGSIVDDQIDIFIDTTFVSSATTIDNDAVLSRTVTGLLGSINADAYGYIASDIVTQFMPSISLDTVGVTESSIENVELVMRYATDGFIGDSIAPMGLEVYPLNRQLPSPIYSNFDPEGYYDKTRKLASKIYVASRENESDSIQKLKYGEIRVNLPEQLGRDFFNKYKEDPASFSSPEVFAKYFPGLYIKNSYGSGRLMRIVKTTIDMKYSALKKINDKDTVITNTATYFAVTPEIICNNNIEYDLSQELRDRRAQGQTLVVAPAGYDAELKFPAREIISSYKQKIGSGLGVINSLNYQIPAELIDNEYNIENPPFLLLVLRSKKDEFFAQNKITDKKTSFYAEYNAAKGYYDFGSMREYILDLLDKDEITEEDVTFIVTPVLVSTETNSDYYQGTSTYVTSITPYVYKPVMVRLLVEDAKVRFVYSRQTLAN